MSNNLNRQKIALEGIKTRSNLGNTSWAVESRIINQIRNFEGLQQIVRKWLVKRLQLFRVVHVMIQPAVECIGVKYHRHAVMDWRHEFVGSSSQDGEGLKFVAVWCLPRLPQASQTHRCLISHLEVVWLFPIASVRPFVKARCRYDAATVFDGMTEGWFFGHGFGTGIYQMAAETQVFGPPWHQTPLQQIMPVMITKVANNGRQLGWCHVEARLKLRSLY